MGLVCLHIREYAQLHELRVGHIIEAEEVGAGFLEGGAVFLERIWRGAREQLSGAVSETLVQVGVNVVGDIEVFLGHIDFLLVEGELVQGALRRLLGSAAVGVGDVGYGNRLRTVVTAYPVRVRQVDADRSCRVAVA